MDVPHLRYFPLFNSPIGLPIYSTSAKDLHPPPHSHLSRQIHLLIVPQPQYPRLAQLSRLRHSPPDNLPSLPYNSFLRGIHPQARSANAQLPIPFSSASSFQVSNSHTPALHLESFRLSGPQAPCSFLSVHTDRLFDLPIPTFPTNDSASSFPHQDRGPHMSHPALCSLHPLSNLHALVQPPLQHRD